MYATLNLSVLIKRTTYFLTTVTIFGITSVFLIASDPVLAHPGRTDANGGHVCRTNCARWGLKPGEYHVHNCGKSHTKKIKSAKKSSSATKPTHKHLKKRRATPTAAKPTLTSTPTPTTTLTPTPTTKPSPTAKPAVTRTSKSEDADDTSLSDVLTAGGVLGVGSVLFYLNKLRK